VCFGIKRQYAKVGCKNLNNFSYKNHLCRFCTNGKQFIENYLLHNFVQFLAQEVAMTSYTTYPKFGHRGFIDFELWQI
jgi:hypothetical protein